jgi:hypothetical protein
MPSIVDEKPLWAAVLIQAIKDLAGFSTEDERERAPAPKVIKPAGSCSRDVLRELPRPKQARNEIPARRQSFNLDLESIKLGFHRDA